MAASKKPLSDNAARYEYPFIGLAVFTRGYTAVEDRARNWDVSILIILPYVSSQGLIFALNARLSFFPFDWSFSGVTSSKARIREIPLNFYIFRKRQTSDDDDICTIRN